MFACCTVSFLIGNSDSWEVFHGLTCFCVRQRGLLAYFGMLALCARVYVAVYAL
jgi:hypothetical protein